MAEIRVAASADPAWASMTETALLTDGSAGDTGTGESASDSESVGASATCQIRLPECALTAEIRYTTEQILSDWRVTGSLSLALAQTQAICVPDEELDYPTVGGAATVKLYAWNGTSFALLDTYTPTVPALVYADESTEAFSSGSRSAEVTSCRFRVVVEYSYTWVGSNNTISIEALLSDLRLTTTNTDTVCDDEEGNPDPQPPADACGCDWDEAAPVTTTWSEAAPVTTTVTEASAPTTTWTRRTCD